MAVATGGVVPCAAIASLQRAVQAEEDIPGSSAVYQNGVTKGYEPVEPEGYFGDPKNVAKSCGRLLLLGKIKAPGERSFWVVNAAPGIMVFAEGNDEVFPNHSGCVCVMLP